MPTPHRLSIILRTNGGLAPQDGTRYEGYVANGSREGWGVMTSAKNEQFRGVWEQGNLVTVTRFSTPECLSAMEAASLAATRAWQVRRCGCRCMSV